MVTVIGTTGHRADPSGSLPGLAAFAVLLAVAGAFTPTSANAQQTTARAYLSPSEVGVGQQFVVNVEISGTQRLDSQPELPDLTNFSVYLGSGTSSSMQMVNGRTSVSLTIEYRYQTISEGVFKIPPISIEADGEEFTTDPLTLTVSKNPPPGPQPRGGRRDAVVIDPTDLFIVAEPSSRTVYENEPLIVDYQLYTSVDVSSYNVTRLPTTTGFWVEELEAPAQPRVQEVTRDGRKYATASLRKVALFPTGPGAKTLESLVIEAQVRVRGGNNPFDAFFGRSSLLGGRQPVGVASTPVEIEVLPLPAEGRPDSFSGLVGDVRVAATLDRSAVDRNEAATLSVEVSGSGNFKTLAAPRVEFPPGFETFEPEISDDVDLVGGKVSGVRRFDFVLIPRVPGTYTIPPIEVGFFTPEQGAYRVAATEALTLEVTGDAAAGDADTGDARRRAGVEELRADIRFIDIETPRFRRLDDRVVGSVGFWVLLVLPMVAMGAAIGVRRHRDRLRGDVAWARQRRASRVARQRLASASTLTDAADPRGYYAEAGRALQGFLADKLNISEAGMIRDEVRGHLRAVGVDDEVTREFLDCLDECDRQRFATPTGSSAEREAFLHRIEAAMDAMDEELTR